MAETTIVLQRESGPVRIPAEHVYFAFASGRLSYNCAACGAHCCRGHGYGLQPGRELAAQLATAQAIRFFVDSCDAERAAHYHVRNCAPGCFFLTDKGECRIHHDHGYEAKPETCRLFPFNELMLVEDFLIVRPHSGLCPLTIMTASQFSKTSQYDELLRSLTLRPIVAEVADGRAIGQSTADLIHLERRIAAESEKYLERSDYAACAAMQLEQTRRMIDSPERGDGSAQPEIENFTNIMTDVLGADTLRGRYGNERLAAAMVGATAALRAHLAFQPLTSREPPSRIPLEQVPLALQALYLLAVLAKDAGIAEPTYQTLMQLFLGYRSFIVMLSHLGGVMVWDTRRPIDLRFPEPRAMKTSFAGVVKALMPRQQMRHPRSLAEILRICAPPSGLDRLAFLKRLAPRLNAGALPLDAYEKRAFRKKLPSRVGMQHWVLDRANPNIVVSFIESATHKRANSRARTSSSENVYGATASR
jgi:Fe-S-cluster containining protein